MATSSSPSKQNDGTTEEEEAEGDVPFQCYHVRTASVILQSGDRVRKKVSLMSICDENPFDDDNERAPLLDSGGTTSTSYSSLARSLIDRGIQSWGKPSCIDKFETWVHSEGLKRYMPLRTELSLGC
jgi:hypothetical protein